MVELFEKLPNTYKNRKDENLAIEIFYVLRFLYVLALILVTADLRG